MTLQLVEANKDWDKIKKLYLTAFPAVERLPFCFLKSKTKKQTAEFCSLYDDDKWIGFIYTLKDATLAYVFFLAIAPEFRSQGYGSRLIKLIAARYQNMVIGLSAERIDASKENNAQRIRRQKFYHRNNFLPSGYYSREKGGEEFDFLTYSQKKVDPQAYPQLMRHVLGFLQPLILPVKMYQI